MSKHIKPTTKLIKASKTKNRVLMVILIAIAVIQLFPLYWLVSFSLKNNTEIFAGNIIGLPQVYRFSNYTAALANGEIIGYFLNSVLVTCTTVIVSSLLGAMAAYAIVRMKWKLSKITLLLFLTGLMIPLHAVLLPLFIVLRDLDMLNSYLALILPYTAFSLPVAIFIFTGFLESIPKEMEEAACIDGANIYRTFFSIIIPMLKPAIATVAIFTFLSNWNELMFAVTFISDKAFKTLPVGIRAFVSKYTTDWGPIGASMVIAVLPTIGIYTLLSKQVQESFRAAGIKG